MANITGVATVNEADVMTVDAPPHTAPGTPAPIGSLALVTTVDGGVWYKFGSLDTDWRKISDPKANITYSNSVDITTNSTTFVDMPLATDRESYLNNMFTKVDVNTMRSNFNGQVRASYSVDGYLNNNDRGYANAISRDGVDLLWTEQIGWGKNLQPRSSSNAFTIILNCTNGSLFKLRIRVTEGGNTVTVPINDARLELTVHRVD